MAEETSKLVRPVILLDVDGVLNACGWDEPKGWDDFQTTVCNGFHITHSQKMAAAIRALDADIVWLTTWRERANEWISPLFDWGHFPALSYVESERYSSWWKAAAAEKYIKENPRPFIWIDDDLTFGIMESDFLNDADFDIPYLLVAPYQSDGLQLDQIEKIATFIEGLKDASD